MRRTIAIVCLALSLSGCGGGSGGGAATPAPSPAPTPQPSPTSSPTPTTFDAAFARLRAGEANGGPLVREAQGVDIVLATETAWPGGVHVGHSDPRLRWLGGRSIVGGNFPYDLTRVGISTNNGDPAVLGGNGLPGYAFGINVGVAFVLPAGQRTFELSLLDAGARTALDIVVDGKAVVADPFPLIGNSPGSELIARVTLPSSTSARTVHLDFGWKPLLGINLPTGETLQPLPVEQPVRVVFIGDSITEGAVAQGNNRAWAMQAAYRLGIGDPVLSGVGGSGYVQRYPAGIGYTFGDRLNDAVRAFDDKAPDAVVVAGGINDCMFEKNPSAQVGTAARAYFTALRTALPGTPIFVIGPWTDWNNPGPDKYETALGRCRDAIFAAGQGIAGLYTIDTTGWVTLANRDTVFVDTTYGPHPVDAGHAFYGRKVADAIAAILAGPR